LILNTIQYLIVDEILLARMLDSKQNLQTEYRDDNADDGSEENIYRDDQTEFGTRKRAPILM
jgi:hypothetical protein